MIGATELSTPINLVVLKDPPASAKKYVINLIGHSTRITVRSPPMQVEALIVGVRNPQFLGSSKVLEKETVFTTVISSRDSSISAQYNAHVLPGVFDCHKWRFGIECLFLKHR